ncbi:FCD domain-containing protein [candidate division KSB3 bacterium]|uniref:FCD domain-containing protein n=1 Tax=candidate division KSB3 bacterium TaxID=2044937 RepID=A0A9D5Q7U0_9BACT|nr:FCD domain-containing protein [candidate division KSB3 bacterium]MBD3327224.1 FCD domain-containing protein [candidate division KSB3 bacterium]
MILSGELQQGERILLDEMSSRLNLSITPIREALNKLAQEDLIVITPRTSYEVISLSADDINDILELRLLLETFALQTAEENLFRFPVQSFRELFRQTFTVENYRDFIEADVKFHRTLIASSKNKKLRKLYSYIHNLIRILLVPAAQVESRIDVSLKEHLAILDAIEAQDLPLTLERLTLHIKNVESILFQIYHEDAHRSFHDPISPPLLRS